MLVFVKWGTLWMAKHRLQQELRSAVTDLKFWRVRTPGYETTNNTQI
jgi:hypothetical protein